MNLCNSLLLSCILICYKRRPLSRRHNVSHYSGGNQLHSSMTVRNHRWPPAYFFFPLHSEQMQSVEQQSFRGIPICLSCCKNTIYDFNLNQILKINVLFIRKSGLCLQKLFTSEVKFHRSYTQLYNYYNRFKWSYCGRWMLLYVIFVTILLLPAFAQPYSHWMCLIFCILNFLCNWRNRVKEATGDGLMILYREQKRSAEE